LVRKFIASSSCRFPGWQSLRERLRIGRSKLATAPHKRSSDDERSGFNKPHKSVAKYSRFRCFHSSQTNQYLHADLSPLVLDSAVRCICLGSLDTLVQSLQPPHAANRHDARCRWAGAYCVVGVIATMKLHKLRIAWSLAWGIAAVLLVALWVRSYDTKDMIAGHISPTCGVCIYSVEGWLDCSSSRIRPYAPAWRWQVDIGDKNVGYHLSQNWHQVFPNFEGGVYFNGCHFQIPYWFLILTATIASSLPFTARRFSLRTLLIAMTLIGVVLGAVFYLVR
jgi:hypothetical protein